MLYFAFQFIALLLYLTQNSDPTLPRIGEVARGLTDQDVAALKLVLPPGSKPWLLIGDPSQIGPLQSIDAYLSPATESPKLRRGSVINVRRSIKYVRGSDGKVLTTAPTAWTARPALEYAQVAIAERDFDQIQGDQDINRPFFVEGRFTDTELIRLVEFLRSNATPTGRNSESIRLWPILAVVRKPDDSVRVTLRGAVMQGQEIVLRQAGQDWLVVTVGIWIA